VGRIGERRGACRFWWGNLKEKDHLEDQDVYGKIISKSSRSIKMSICTSLFTIHIMSVFMHGNYEMYLKNGNSRKRMAGIGGGGRGLDWRGSG